jgi:predicted transcriptional regulator
VNLLLSIHPNYSELIFSGEKTFELRRRLPKLSHGDVVWVYETAPTQAIVGSFVVEKLHLASPQTIWRKTGILSCVKKNKFDTYYAGCPLAFAIGIQNAIRLKRKIDLSTLKAKWQGFSPPQSFRYVPDEINLRTFHQK